MIISSVLTSLFLAALLYNRIAAPFLIILCIVLPLVIIFIRTRNNYNNGSFLQIDVLAQSSHLIEWNTGLKVISAIVFLIFCVAADSLVLAVTILAVMTIINICTNNINVKGYINLLLIPVTFVILSGLVLLTDINLKPLGYLDIQVFNFYLSITAESQMSAALIIAKSLGALSCMYALSLSTPVYEITSFLRRIHVPAIIIELMILIYRYIFLLLETLHNMKMASDSRLGKINYKSSWRSFKGIASNLLIRSFIKASRSFDAMEARCYNGEIRFLEQIKPIKIKHGIAAGGLFLFFCIVLFLERGLKLI